MPSDRQEQVADRMVQLLIFERKRKGLSLNRLAWMSGISPSALAFMEKGVHSPTLKSFLRIASALELDAAKVFWEADRSVEGGAE